MKQLVVTFNEVISVENLLAAWREFLSGKKQKRDVREFQFHLMDSILALHSDLAKCTYRHGGYYAFNICDPKPRNIHKASVRDRLLHHAIYRKLYPFFDKVFIADSFSCRNNKGTHNAGQRFKKFFYQVSQNSTRTCWVLKCDIKKFFANIDHQTLLEILERYIPDQQIIWLLEKVTASFHSRPGIGLPLGNLTSQLLVNIYLNELDQYVKQILKIKYYLRYTDDFVLLSADKEYLLGWLSLIREFLKVELRLELHPKKITIKTISSGVDWLGWVYFVHQKTLRTVTKRRMLKKLSSNPIPQAIASYRGLLSHGDTYRLQGKIISTGPNSFPGALGSASRQGLLGLATRRQKNK